MVKINLEQALTFATSPITGKTGESEPGAWSASWQVLT